jgi:hypothetical protein
MDCRNIFSSTTELMLASEACDSRFDYVQPISESALVSIAMCYKQLMPPSTFLIICCFHHNNKTFRISVKSEFDYLQFSFCINKRSMPLAPCRSIGFRACKINAALLIPDGITCFLMIYLLTCVS